MNTCEMLSRNLLVSSSFWSNDFAEITETSTSKTKAAAAFILFLATIWTKLNELFVLYPDNRALTTNLHAIYSNINISYTRQKAKLYRNRICLNFSPLIIYNISSVWTLTVIASSTRQLLLQAVTTKISTFCMFSKISWICIEDGDDVSIVKKSRLTSIQVQSKFDFLLWWHKWSYKYAPRG